MCMCLCVLGVGEAEERFPPTCSGELQPATLSSDVTRTNHQKNEDLTSLEYCRDEQSGSCMVHQVCALSSRLHMDRTFGTQ